MEIEFYDGRDMQRVTRSKGLPVGSCGFSATVSFTPAAAAYSAADIIDVAKVVNFNDLNGIPVPPGSLIRVLTSVVKIDETAIISGETSYTLHFYSVTPPSAQADNAAWSLASADLSAYRGSIALGTPADLGAACYIKTQYTDADLNLATGLSTMYAELVTVGGFTATAVARQILLYGVYF